MHKLVEKIVNNKKIFTAVICFLILLIVGSVIGIAVLLTPADSGKTEPELVVSVDFNENSGGFIPTAWVPENSEFEHVTNGGLEDTGCVKVSNTDINDARYELSVEADEDTYYKVSGWIKTEDVGVSEGAAGANISILNTFESYEYIYGTEDWKYVEFYGKTVENQTDFTVALRVGFYSGDNTGTAWFDDVRVYKLSDIPDSVACINFEDTLTKSDDTSESENEMPLDENFYEDLTKAAVILTVFVFLAFLIAYRYARAYDGIGRKKPLEPPCGEPMSVTKALIAIFIIGIAIRVICALSPMQCSVDVNIFKYWGNEIVSGGFTETYKTLEGSIDYPPLYVYVLFAASAIKDLFSKFEYQEMIYSLLIKLTPIIADCLIGVLIYKICDKKMRTEWKVFAVAAWILNPVVIIDSAIWGQVDSVLALFVLLSLYYGEKRTFLLSGILLGLGVMLKPQAIIVFPIIFYMLMKYFIEEKVSLKKKFASLGYMAAGFVGGAVVPCLPFIFKMGMVETEVFGKTINVPWILSLFAGTANHYSYSSVNALNFWFILGKNWVDDSEKLGPLSLFLWGMIAIVIICAAIWVLYILCKNKKYMPYVFAGALYLCVSMFAPRMHERYFFPAVAFFAVAFVMSNNRILLWIYTALSSFGFLTIAEVLLDLEVGQYLKDTTADYDRYSYFLWVAESDYRCFLAWAMVLLSLVTIVFAILVTFNVIGNKPKFEMIWKETDLDDFDSDDAPLLSVDYDVESPELLVDHIILFDADNQNKGELPHEG